VPSKDDQGLTPFGPRASLGPKVDCGCLGIIPFPKGTSKGTTITNGDSLNSLFNQHLDIHGKALHKQTSIFGQPSKQSFPSGPFFKWLKVGSNNLKTMT